MIPKPFNEITKADIEALIANAVIESKSLDYKEKLPENSDGEKKEFLADVSSFANATGGDIVYGIKAAMDGNGKKTGGPGKVVCIQDRTADQAKLTLEETIRNGIAPRVPVQIREITGCGDDGQGFVLLVRIPQSHNSPHMVIYKGSSRFYSRHSSGKYQLDVDELRAGFLATESQGQRVRNFLLDRIAKIRADDTVVPLNGSRRIVLHLIPISHFLSGRRLQLDDRSRMMQISAPYIYNNWRYSLDGFIAIADCQNNTADAYCQLMFNGCVEFVRADVAWNRQGDQALLVADFLAYSGYIDTLYAHLIGLKQMDISPPFVIHAAILGCAEGIVDSGSSYAGLRVGLYVHEFGKDEILFPEVILNEFPQSENDFRTMLKPLGDSLFNASGMPKHNGYGPDGKWNKLKL